MRRATHQNRAQHQSAGGLGGSSAPASAEPLKSVCVGTELRPPRPPRVLPARPPPAPRAPRALRPRRPRSLPAAPAAPPPPPPAAARGRGGHAGQARAGAARPARPTRAPAAWRAAPQLVQPASAAQPGAHPAAVPARGPRRPARRPHPALGPASRPASLPGSGAADRARRLRAAAAPLPGPQAARAGWDLSAARGAACCLPRGHGGRPGTPSAGARASGAPEDARPGGLGEEPPRGRWSKCENRLKKAVGRFVQIKQVSIKPLHLHSFAL